MKEYDIKELRLKAEAYCSAAEHCASEVSGKLRQWGASDEDRDAIIAYLFKEKYIDSVRYCGAFARDKYRFACWGRIKIAQALKMKGLSTDEITAGMEEIDNEEYHAILRDMLIKKQKSITARNNYERNMKLMRFAVGRGFRMDEIRKHIESADDTEYME